ncbi:Carboxylesterase NlhH [Palleronia sp. THAF1]|nr:Carboxylesterase NlhH [Palleronia sp. THAF1]
MSLHPALTPIAADPKMTVRVPPPTVPFAAIRKAANAAMSTGPRPDMARVEDTIVDAATPVPVRLYHPSNISSSSVIVFYHGGGFVWGSLDTHDGLCRRMASRTGAKVVSVGYRLSPEAPFPAAETDVGLVTDALIEGFFETTVTADRLILCGDSAGGYLAFLETCRLVDRGTTPAGLGLIYPALDPSCSGQSHVTNAGGPILTTEAMRWFWTCHAPFDIAPPFEKAPLHTFPPTHILVAGHDPLRNDGTRLHDHLSDLNVKSTLLEAPDMAHGFLNLPMAYDVWKSHEMALFDSLGATVMSHGAV